MAGNDFARTLKSEQIADLKRQELFLKKLLPDILSGEVFPSIRRNRIDFYYGGGKLFSFTDSFSTHIKYASALTYRRPYITENDLQNAIPIQNFLAGYETIKANCRLYSGIEAEAVSRLYANSSPFGKEANVVILDIEVSLRRQDETDSEQDSWESPDRTTRRARQDRIDLLFFDKNSKTLKFFEAKHFSNKELWSEKGTVPDIRRQIGRYKNQIRDNGELMLKQYRNFVEIMWNVFDLDGSTLPLPEHLSKDVVLLLFGFDDSQKKRIKELLISDGSLSGISLRARGNYKDKKFTAAV
ncbi:hypothetical protein JCM30471_08270 [Desulfuromonas carbonis]